MRRVYVGRISHHVRERDIERFFRSEGKIREVLMKDGFAFVEFDHSSDAEAAVRHLNGRDINGDRVHVEFAKGPPRGGGAAGGSSSSGGRFNGPSSSRGSMNRNGPLNRNFRSDRGRDRGEYSGGRTGNSGGGGISYAEKYGPPRNTDFRVIVENLSTRVSWQDLKDLMRQAGEVTFADAHKRERNVGIVDFASHKDMKQAIETLNDTEFHGRRIKIFEDKTRRHRSSGGNGSISGRRSGRSRSRSRSRGRYSSSRSRERLPSSKSRSRSRSRTRSPVTRDRSSKSRSRSTSDSPARRKTQRSPSRSRSRSRDSPRDEKRHSRSVSRSRSRSASADSSSKQQRSRSRSRSASSTRSQNSNANNNNHNNNSNNNKLLGEDRDRSPESRSSSRSASPDSKKPRLSSSPGGLKERATTGASS